MSFLWSYSKGLHEKTDDKKEIGQVYGGPLTAAGSASRQRGRGLVGPSLLGPGPHGSDALVLGVDLWDLGGKGAGRGGGSLRRRDGALALERAGRYYQQPADGSWNELHAQ